MILNEWIYVYLLLVFLYVLLYTYLQNVETFVLDNLKDVLQKLNKSPEIFQEYDFSVFADQDLNPIAYKINEEITNILIQKHFKVIFESGYKISKIKIRKLLKFKNLSLIKGNLEMFKTELVGKTIFFVFLFDKELNIISASVKVVNEMVMNPLFFQKFDALMSVVNVCTT